MAEGNTETSKELELNPLFGTLEGIDPEEIFQIDSLQASERLPNAESTVPEISSQHEPIESLPSEPPQCSTHEALTAKIDGATPYIETDLIGPFENPDPGLLAPKDTLIGIE